MNYFGLISEVKEVLMQSLGIFWKGMLAIVIVISIVAGITALINYFAGNLEKTKKNKDEAEE